MTISQEYIEIRGARENNLQEVSLRLPKRKIIIFTGVSGSGKSSVVFDTIAQEAQRLLFENFSMFILKLHKAPALLIPIWWQLDDALNHDDRGILVKTSNSSQVQMVPGPLKLVQR